MNLPTTCWTEIGDECVSNFRMAFTWPPELVSQLPEGPELVSELTRLIQSARTSIDLYFYNINSNREFVLARSLHEMVARRGVSMRIFCNKRSEARQMFDTFRNIDTNILAYYWDVPANQMSKFHVKAIVVDKRRFYLGSANMSVTAMSASAECGLFGTDPHIAAQLGRYVQLFIESGSLVGIE